MRAKGMGAHVIVCEVDPLPALEAVMDGFEVMPAVEAAREGDIFITVTGDMHVIGGEPLREHEGRRDRRELGPLQRRDRHPGAGADVHGQARGAAVRRGVRDSATAGSIFLLAEGRLINLAAAEGHPAAVMDMSFANQALSAEHMVKNADELEKKVYVVPEEIDKEIAALKLESMGVAIDSLTRRAGEVPDQLGPGT